MKRWSKFVVILFVAAAIAGPAAAQLLPLPKSAQEPPVICTGCYGTNWHSQPNDGLPMVGFSSPIARHVGRLVDSTSTRDYQHAMGGTDFRTARAGAVVAAPQQRGSAPPRVYVKIGSAVTAHSLDTFFTADLAGGTVPLGSFMRLYDRSRTPSEQVAQWDAHIYPENSTQWKLAFADGQDRLGEFDVDDRGYIYAAYIHYGWGVVRDDGSNGGAQLPLVKQVTTSSEDPTWLPLTPEHIVVLKSGAKYYVVVSDVGAYASVVYDVTNPAAPQSPFHRKGTKWGVKKWSKDPTSDRFAYIDGAKNLHIYDTSSFAMGAAALADYGSKFAAISFDEHGTLWAAEESTANLWRLTPSGGGYTKQVFSAGSAPFAPAYIHASAGFIALAGALPNGAVPPSDLRLFKVENGQPRQLDTKDFFRNYYHAAPRGYAQPAVDPVNYTVQQAVYLMKHGGKVYLFYNCHGIGDVYELEAGDSINVAITGVDGTANPNAQPTQSGPFYGDILKFKAAASNPASQFRLAWDFGNAEAGSGAYLNSDLNEVVSYQYTGLTTAAKIQAPKTGTVTSASDSTISSPFTVNLKVPKARIGIAGRTGAIEAGAASFDVVAGDSFTDASDGSVESHFAKWTIDGISTNLLPNATMPAGALGQHTLSFSASYGKYDPVSFIASAPYVDNSLANLSYTVRPFVVSLLPPTRAGSNVTFAAEQGRYTKDSQLLSATEWVVTWSLNGTVLGQPKTEPVGTITPLTLPQSEIPSNSVLKLEVSVDPSLVPSTTYQSHSATMTLSPPDPAIQVSGCLNVGEPCTLTAISEGTNSTADWKFNWVVTNGGSTIKTGSEKTLSVSFTQPATYTAVLTATKTVFDITVQKTLPVAAALCGNPPADYQLAFSSSCSTNCPVGQPISFHASIFQYALQDCDTVEWNFGDGSAVATGLNVTHAFGSARSYTVKMTVKNPKGATSVTQTIQVGAPQPTCNAPNSVGVTYNGDKGCSTGSPCKTGEVITFRALKNGMAAGSCDSATWTFGNGVTSSGTLTTQTFSTAGTYPVTVTVSNVSGSNTSAPVNLTIVQDTSGGSCPIPPSGIGVYIDFAGATSGCTPHGANQMCRPGEAVQFTAAPYRYTFQACDKFEWNFGDGSPLSNQRDPLHHFVSGATSSYVVRLRVYNDNDLTGVTLSQEIKFENTVPVKPLPVLSAAQFPGTGAKGSALTFTATSDVPATDWAWDFGDGTKMTSSEVGMSSTMTHTFKSTGTFNVSVRARNAEDAATAPTSLASKSIKVDETPEYRYLLPVVAHISGQNGSAWRTDVQVYNPDPNASASNPLRMTATFQGTQTELEIPQSTFIYEDFMRQLRPGDNQGAVIITAKTRYAPQIWTRTYNQTDDGTFGQFIPAIRLDSGAGAANAGGVGKYYLAGLRDNGRFRTNVGLLNATMQPVTATVKVYDHEGLIIGEPTNHTLSPFTPLQFPAGGSDRPFSVEIEVPDGQWILAYASLVDGGSNDPVFMQAVRASDLTSSDYRDIVLPGVGHVATWRSDVTIFNPNGRKVNVDLAYHDASGAKVAEATNVPVGAGEFLQYSDVLKEGILGDVADSVGLLRVTVPPSITADHFPMAIARTYSDKGDGRTFGQGVAGFAAARPNVTPTKPALIAGVRDVTVVEGSRTTGYYTNVGAVNVSASEVVVTFTMLHAGSGARGRQQQYTLAPNQSIISRFELDGADFASIEVTTTGGAAWAYASIVDRGTDDPEYVPATPLAP